MVINTRLTVLSNYQKKYRLKLFTEKSEWPETKTQLFLVLFVVGFFWFVLLLPFRLFWLVSWIWAGLILTTSSDLVQLGAVRHHNSAGKKKKKSSPRSQSCFVEMGAVTDGMSKSVHDLFTCLYRKGLFALPTYILKLCLRNLNKTIQYPCLAHWHLAMC